MSKIYASDAVEFALSQVGYIGKKTNDQLDDFTANQIGKFNKYARDLWEKANPHFWNGNKNGFDWCTSFYADCIYEAADHDSVAAQAALCYTGPYGAGCKFAVNYYDAAGRFWPRMKADPKPGDQIFFGTADNIRHTGMVVEVGSGKIVTVEGNSNLRVRKLTYASNDPNIYGYGRPKYDGDTPPDDGMPFVDVKKSAWYYDAVKWGYDNGITVGTDPTHFNPNKACTRAEVMQIEQNTYDLIIEKVAKMIKGVG